ncbi:MAG: sugar transferase, partial [Gemmatimonadota bacterium]
VPGTPPDRPVVRWRHRWPGHASAAGAARPAGASDVGAPEGERATSGARAERILDIALAGYALLVLSPLLFVIAVLIRLDSKGPVLYRQLRIGLDRRDWEDGFDGEANSRRTADLGGCPFTIYKFRTMHVDAERATGPVWASPDDQRVTRVGAVLRRFRLDELPQFWNVLRGDMAIVGPRPERPSFVHILRNQVDGYRLRHRVRPGITGWAQVNQEPDQSLNDVQHKLEYDLEYLRRRSLSFDLRIMLRTLPVMLERVKTRH